MFRRKEVIETSRLTWLAFLHYLAKLETRKFHLFNLILCVALLASTQNSSCWKTKCHPLHVEILINWDISLIVSIDFRCLPKKNSDNLHGARYHGRHGERRLCAYQMAGLCSVLVIQLIVLQVKVSLEYASLDNVTRWYVCRILRVC